MPGRNELIVFERETRTPDGGGGASSSWDEIGQAWADVTWIGGSETQRQGAVRETVRYRFTVLSAAVVALGITVADRIRWNGELFNIRETPRRLPRRPVTEIIAEAGVSQ